MPGVFVFVEARDGEVLRDGLRFEDGLAGHLVDAMGATATET